MAGERKDKVGSVLKKIVSSFVRLQFETNVIISVTKVTIADNLKRATVFITVYPESKEVEILKQFKEKEYDLRQHVKKHFKSKFLPIFHVAIDYGEKNQQRIDEILG